MPFGNSLSVVGSSRDFPGAFQTVSGTLENIKNLEMSQQFELVKLKKSISFENVFWSDSASW